MASSLIPKASYHARSISLPSRLHPIAEQLDEQLNRLRSSQAASTSFSSLSRQLNGLKDLYSCVEEFLQLPLHQQTKCVDESHETLDRSLRLLDICTTLRDVLVNSKLYLQDLQSGIRRRCNGDSSIAIEAAEYLKSRKITKKTIKKCLQGIKPVLKNDEGNDAIFLLNDVEAVTVDCFKALLSYFGGVKAQSTKSRWSTVAKVFSQRSEKEGPISEFDALDATLCLISMKKKTGINSSEIEDLRTRMVELESDIQDFDELLECLFRHLVKTRASLLNILSN